MKVWFQNRRTKHKRVQSEDGDVSGRSDVGEGCRLPENDYIDVESPPSPGATSIDSPVGSTLCVDGDDADDEADMAQMNFVHAQRLHAQDGLNPLQGIQDLHRAYVSSAHVTSSVPSPSRTCTDYTGRYPSSLTERPSNSHIDANG